MAQIHFILQGKGGVGKSTLASFMAQYFQSKDRKLIAIDTDPNNATFSSYKALKATHLKLGEKADEINPRAFDVLIEQIIESAFDSIFVIDNGASSFLPLSAYLLENDVFTFLQDNEHDVFLHVVLAGGDMFQETVDGLGYLADSFVNVRFVVWENSYYGPIKKDGKSIEESNLFQQIADKIYAIIKLPTIRRETFGADVAQLLQQRLTFSEGLADKGFSIMAKQRLKQVSAGIFAQLEQANF